MQTENETPYTTETTRLTPITERIAPVVRHTTDALLGMGLVVSGALIGIGMVTGVNLLGLLTASTLFRTLQIYWAFRGWIVLGFICIGFAAYSVWYSNRQPQGEPQRMIAILWRGYCIRSDV